MAPFNDHMWCFYSQEFSGIGGLTESSDLETEMTKVPARTLEILASCHALVFVENKLVSVTNFINLLGNYVVYEKI